MRRPSLGWRPHTRKHAWSFAILLQRIPGWQISRRVGTGSSRPSWTLSGEHPIRYANQQPVLRRVQRLVGKARECHWPPTVRIRARTRASYSGAGSTLGSLFCTEDPMVLSQHWASQGRALSGVLPESSRPDHRSSFASSIGARGLLAPNLAVECAS